LQAVEAVQPLLSFIEDYESVWEEWIWDEFPGILSQIGPGALPILSAYLEQTPINGMYAQSTLCHAIANIGLVYPETRDAAVATLIAVLERYEEHDEFLNGTIIGDLIDLKALEALPVIERAFASGRVDEFVSGDWDDVQVEFGLKAPSPDRKRRVAPWIDVSDLLEEIEIAEEEAFEEELEEEAEVDFFVPVGLPPADFIAPLNSKTHSKVVNKRKQAAKNRKINRKKK
jgi:hypothetical protein